MLTDWQGLVDGLVRDDSGVIVAADRDAAIAGAVIRYSVDRPRPVVLDVAAAGGHLLDRPTGHAAWDEGFSAITALECPPDEAPPAVLSGWRGYRTPDGERIMLADALGAGETVRVTFAARHVVSDSEDTVPIQDRHAVAGWAAGILLDQLATATAGATLPTIASDSVNHQSKSADYARRAAAYRKAYLDHIGVEERRNVPAGAVTVIPSRGQDGGRRVAPGHRRGVGR